MTTNAIRVGKASRLAELMAQEDISLDDASLVLDHLSRKGKVGEENADFMFKFNCHAWDGAVALKKAIDKVFGFSFGESTFSFFEGEKLSQMIEVQTGAKPEDKITVPWGKLTLPGVDGWIRPAMFNSDFVLSCSIKRKHEEQVKELAAEIGRVLRDESIYRGKAVRLVYNTQPFEEVLLIPEFLQLAGLDDSQLILNQDVREAVEISLFTPIEQRQAVKDAGIEWRRGVLLSGGYGTGKSLTAAITAGKAEAAGITFVMCDSGHLGDALEFAKSYAPATVFCEDVDGSLINARTTEVNAILDSLDGVASKEADVMVVLTTNSVANITKAAIRPGRCDAVIEFELPNLATTEALVRAYAGSALATDSDISSALAGLVGNSPAVIAEATKRARLAAIRAGEKVITPELLVTAARTMRGQIELLRRPETVSPSGLERAAVVIGHYLQEALKMSTQHSSEVRAAAKAIENGKEGTIAPAPWEGAVAV
jgi:hypothetical protein